MINTYKSSAIFISRILFILLLTMAGWGLISPPKAMAANSCEWDISSNGNLRFKVSGFPSEAAAKEHEVRFHCTSNCGRWGLTDWWSQTFGGQTVPVTNVAKASDGTYWTAWEMGGFDQSVIDTTNDCMSGKVRQLIQDTECGVNSVGEYFANIGLSLTGVGGAIKWVAKDIPDCWKGLGEVFSGKLDKSLDECVPGLAGTVRDGSNQFCSEEIPQELVMGELRGLNDARFALCNQISADDTESLDACQKCVGDPENPEAIWTAIGCIPTKAESIVKTFVSLGLSIGGGTTLLLILAGSFRLSTSQGDPTATKEAKEQITAAIIGLVFIIFFITMLRFIGVTLFNIPGFGG